MIMGSVHQEKTFVNVYVPNIGTFKCIEDPDAGKGRRQEEKGMTEDEMVGWHHRLNGHGFE